MAYSSNNNNNNNGHRGSSVTPSPMRDVSPGPAYTNGNQQYNCNARQGSPGAMECTCPSCHYYKANHLYNQECQSPNVDAFNMYPYTYYPTMASMMPFLQAAMLGGTAGLTPEGIATLSMQAEFENSMMSAAAAAAAAATSAPGGIGGSNTALLMQQLSSLIMANAMMQQQQQLQGNGTVNTGLTPQQQQHALLTFNAAMAAAAAAGGNGAGVGQFQQQQQHQHQHQHQPYQQQQQQQERCGGNGNTHHNNTANQFGGLFNNTAGFPFHPVTLQQSSEEQFSRVIGTIAQTACTASGRTLLQQVMRLQHVDKIKIIFDEVLADCTTVVLDTHGCHVVRSLLEVMDTQQVEKFIAVLTPTLILNMCTLTQFTRRVLQTLFDRHKAAHSLHMVIDVVATNAQYLAATQQGCISWMRVFEHCSAEDKARLVAPLLPTFPDLATDPFGNYVVQCTVEHSEGHVAAEYVVSLFSGKLLKLSCNKFASNVMEKVVRNPSPIVRRIVLDELVFNPAALQQMVQDPFANFVVQSIIETSSQPAELKKICDRLRPAIPQSPFGHKIEAKIRSKRPTQALQSTPVNTFFGSNNGENNAMMMMMASGSNSNNHNNHNNNYNNFACGNFNNMGARQGSPMSTY